MSEVLFFEYLMIQDLIDPYSDKDDIKRVKQAIRELEENHRPIFQFRYFPIVQGLPKHPTIAELEITVYNHDCYNVVEKFRYWDDGREFATLYETCNLQSVIKGVAGLLHQHFNHWEHSNILPNLINGDDYIIHQIMKMLGF